MRVRRDHKASCTYSVPTTITATNHTFSSDNARSVAHIVKLTQSVYLLSYCCTAARCQREAFVSIGSSEDGSADPGGSHTDAQQGVYAQGLESSKRAYRPEPQRQGEEWGSREIYVTQQHKMTSRLSVSILMEVALDTLSASLYCRPYQLQ